jgi:hypothetical protein
LLVINIKQARVENRRLQSARSWKSSKKLMALDPEEVQKPLSKLRKLLKKMPKQPTPDQVHDLRTNSRRLEATLTALKLDRKRRGKRVLKTLAIWTYLRVLPPACRLMGIRKLWCNCWNISVSLDFKLRADCINLLLSAGELPKCA